MNNSQYAGDFYSLIIPLLTLKFAKDTLETTEWSSINFFLYITLHPTKYITLVSAVILQFG